MFVGGINSAKSIRNRKSSDDIKYVYHRLLQILAPYAFATLIYSIYKINYFDLSKFLKHLILFDTVGPFYFVLFYVQLLGVSTILYSLVYASRSLFKKASLLVISYIIGIICVKFTFILPVHGGGKYFLGGSYLFLFCAGICFDEYLKPIPKRVLLFLFSFMSLCLFSLILVGIPPKIWVNPPNILGIIYIFIIFFLIYSAQNILLFTPNLFARYINKVFSFIGRNSLYIYLYHILFIEIALKFNLVSPFSRWLNISNYGKDLLTWSWLLFMTIIPASMMRLFYEYAKNRIVLFSLREMLISGRSRHNA